MFTDNPLPSLSLQRFLAEASAQDLVTVVHGFNISNDSPNCRVMASDEQYTPAMRAATTPVGTGGNPNVGPPVRSLPYRFLPLPTSLDLW